MSANLTRGVTILADLGAAFVIANPRRPKQLVSKNVSNPPAHMMHTGGDRFPQAGSRTKLTALDGAGFSTWSHVSTRSCSSRMTAFASDGLSGRQRNDD
jgi:hypothetical protein